MDRRLHAELERKMVDANGEIREDKPKEHQDLFQPDEQEQLNASAVNANGVDVLIFDVRYTPKIFCRGRKRGMYPRNKSLRANGFS